MFWNLQNRQSIHTCPIVHKVTASLDGPENLPYARKWQYQLNSSKSVIMVFGEATRTRLRERSQRMWHLGKDIVSEVDEQHHLGILRTVGSSTITRTNERAAACRLLFQLCWFAFRFSPPPHLPKVVPCNVYPNTYLRL